METNLIGYDSIPSDTFRFENRNSRIVYVVCGKYVEQKHLFNGTI